MTAAYSLLFGYRHVTGLPQCPTCRADGNPGDYMLMEQSTEDPLDVLFRCWCGATLRARMESPDDLTAFLKKQGVTPE